MSSTPVSAPPEGPPEPSSPPPDPDPSMSPFSDAAALYGPLLLALYFVTTSRWGSYVLPGPPYIGDLFLTALIVQRLWLLARGTLPAPLLSRAIALPAGLLLLYAAVVLALGEHSTVALRDGAPYFYAVLVFFGQSYRRASASTVERLVLGALLLHSTWYTISVLFPSFTGPTTLGDGSVTIFGLRSDIDGVFNGVLVAVALDRVALGRLPLVNVALAAWALSLILLNNSRSSFLALLLMLLLVALRFVILWRSDATPPDQTPGGWTLPERWMNPALAVLVVIAVPIVLTLGDHTPAALERSINVAENRVDPGSNPLVPGDAEGGGAPDDEETGPDGGPPPIERVPGTIDTGVGTVQARSKAWRAVIDWIPDGGVSRVALGVGFGPQYMHLSGADVAFQGDYFDPTVRAVHNFELNTWARLGLVGVILFTSILLVGLVAAVRLLARSYEPPILDLLAGLLVVGIPVTALLGVVLESPFGAIPCFWAVGYLGARMVEEGLWRPVGLPAAIEARTKPSPPPTAAGT